MKFLNGSIKNRVLVFATIFLAVCALFGSFFLLTQKCWAETKYEDDMYVAVVNDDGLSGHIDFKKNMRWYIDKKYVLEGTERVQKGDVIAKIGDTPLKDIVKFKCGGFVEEIWLRLIINYRLLGIVPSRTLECNVTASGPKGLGSGSGLIKFIDNKKEQYYLNIYRHAKDNHNVCISLPEIGSNLDIIRVEWSS